MDNYDDIINEPHHVSPSRKPMSMEARAAQFAPFAALSGHEELLEATAIHSAEAADADSGVPEDQA